MQQGFAKAWVGPCKPACANMLNLATTCEYVHRHLLFCCVYRCPGTKRAMEAMTKRQVGYARYLYGTMRMVRYLDDADTEVRWLP